MKKANRGFTLVELITVIAIIAVLGAILVIVIPLAVEKANAASAMSDARNSTKSYVVAESTPAGSGYENLVFVVEKAGKYYVFGYNCYSDEIYECAGNPFESDSPDALMNTLVQNKHVNTNNESYKDITSDIPDIMTGTHCYGNCRLEYVPDDVVIYDDYIYVPVGYGYKIEENITVSHIEDSSVAEFEDGKVTGKASGTTVIHATGAEGEQTYRVTVDEYTDFGGNANDLKALMESDAEYTFIKCNENSLLNDENLSSAIYPICIPKGKTVIINLNAGSLFFGHGDINTFPKSIFENIGGRFTVFSDKESNSMNELVCFGELTEGVADDSCSFIHSKNGYTEFSGIKIYASGINTAISNDGGKMNISNSGIRGSANCFIRNGENAMLDMYDCVFSQLGVCIENSGTIGGISDCNIKARRNHTAIINSGTIDILDGSHIISDFESDGIIENDTACIIMNNASKMNKMSDTTVETSGYYPGGGESAHTAKIYAVILKGDAYIGEQHNCNLTGFDGSIFNA